MRVAVIGIGNELNGDDAAGVLVVRLVTEYLVARGLDERGPGHFPAQPGISSDLLLIEGATAPENFTGRLRQFKPELVVMVDAAEMSAPPGTIQWIDWHQAGGMSASTHTLPPSVLSRFLVEEFGCQVVLLGIQPAHLDFDRPMSDAARAGASQAAREIIERCGWHKRPP
jgi:hydrogenase 3 maturation protease